VGPIRSISSPGFTSASSASEVPGRSESFGDNGLPVPRTSLIGRDLDVGRTVRALRQDGVRLVTVTGPGGVGKTRIAIEAAHQLTHRSLQSVAFVSLVGVASATDLAGVIAGSLGLGGAAGGSALDVVRAGLRHRDAIVVLDNFEHLLEAIGDLTVLLDSCPALRLLITSRTPLRVAGEHVIEVGPLAVPTQTGAMATTTELAELEQVPSVQLFSQRAAAVQRDFALGAGNAQPVVAICQRLAGLPLAIELAAARLSVLTPAVLLERLDTDPLGVLARGARDLPAHQRSLRATIAWSHALLSAEEQVLLQRLGVFEHGFSLDAAEAVCTDPPGKEASSLASTLGTAEVLDGLTTLVDLHLVDPDIGAT
jgi:predicted ATPase